MTDLRREAVDYAYEKYPNCKSFDMVWIGLGRYVYAETWNRVLMPHLNSRLVDAQYDSSL